MPIRDNRTWILSALLALMPAVLAGCSSGARTASSGAGHPVSIHAAPARPVATGQSGASFLTAAANPRAGSYVYAAWTTYPENPDDANSWLVASADSGATWSKPRPLGDDTSSQPTLAVADDGTLYAAWSEWDLTKKSTSANPTCLNPTVLVIESSHDHGATWSKPKPVTAQTTSTCEFYGRLGLSDDGRTLVASWFDYATNPGADATVVDAATSTDDGSTFGTPHKLDLGCVCCTASTFTVDGRPALAWRGWQAEGSGGELRNPHSAVLQANDTWGSPATVHDDDFRFRVCPHVGIGAATDVHGTATVAWWTGAKGREGYWYATTRNGTIYTAPVEISVQHADPMNNDVTVADDAQGNAWISAVTVPGADSTDSGQMTMSPDTSIHVWLLAHGALVEAPTLANIGSYPVNAASAAGDVALWVDSTGSKLVAERLTASRKAGA